MTATPPPYPDPSGRPPPPVWVPPAPAPRPPWVTRREVRTGLVVVGVLLVVGALAGAVWLWWSPPRGIALALGPHTLLPDETEAFVAADGRFAALTAGIGLVAGLVGWGLRSVRGPVTAAALAVGCVAGAGVTALVGRLFGGGQAGAATQQVVTPPLELRATGLLVLEAVVALLVYGVSVTVSARDDLGVDGRRADTFDGARPVEPTDLPPPRS